MTKENEDKQENLSENASPDPKESHESYLNKGVNARIEKHINEIPKRAEGIKGDGTDPSNFPPHKEINVDLDGKWKKRKENEKKKDTNERAKLSSAFLCKVNGLEESFVILGTSKRDEGGSYVEVAKLYDSDGKSYFENFGKSYTIISSEIKETIFATKDEIVKTINTLSSIAISVKNKIESKIDVNSELKNQLLSLDFYRRLLWHFIEKTNCLKLEINDKILEFNRDSGMNVFRKIFNSNFYEQESDKRIFDSIWNFSLKTQASYCKAESFVLGIHLSRLKKEEVDALAEKIVSETEKAWKNA